MKRQNTYHFYVNPGRKECGYNGTVSSYAEVVQYSEINNTKPRLLDGYAIRTIQELMGHKHLETAMIYTHVLNHGASAVKSPADRL